MQILYIYVLVLDLMKYIKINSSFNLNCLFKPIPKMSKLILTYSSYSTPISIGEDYYYRTSIILDCL